MDRKSWSMRRRAAAAIAVVSLLSFVGRGVSFAASIKATNFKGRYTASYHAFDASITGTDSEPNPPAVPYAVSGAMVSDGKGNVTGFLNGDYGSPDTGYAYTCSTTGTYTVGPEPVGGSVKGFVTISLTSSCKTVTCTGAPPATPSCAASGAAFAGSPVQLFCALSGTSGKALDCTEMGETASGTTFQTPITASHWAQQ